MISVIMPVYNAERTVRQAILSAMSNRGYTAVEMIVVDDGSTDRTPGILHELQKEMPIHVIRQSNMGPGAARNVALKQVHGEFVAFLDADDYFAPMALARMEHCMQWREANACVAGTRHLMYGLPTNVGIECWHKLNKHVIDALDERNFLVEITPGVRAKMFKREVLDGLVFPEGVKWEDLAFTPAALAKAGRIAVMDEVVYNYRIHFNTTMKDFLFRCKVEDILESAEALRKNLQVTEIDDPRVYRYYRSMLTLHTVFRMHNVMTWVNVNRAEKRRIVRDLASRLTLKYPGWREDAVLCDPELSYKDPFFQNMLKRLYKNYLS